MALIVGHQPVLKRVVCSVSQFRFYSAPAERSIPAAKQKFVPTSGEYPKRFLLGTAHAGVKASNTKYDDVALVASETPCNATAIFTRNAFQAGPVLASKNTLKERQAGFHGVVVNSGCANAVTGIQGIADADAMAATADRCFDPSSLEPPADPSSDTTPARTLVMSTGVIGQRLPIDRINEAIPKAHAALGATHEHWLAAAQAISTTDTFPKIHSRTFTLPSHPETTYRIAGIVKGAGMIHPNMGTLLGIVCTDAKLDPISMRKMLRIGAGPSFNSISIDGDTSTNDTIALLANGAAAPEGSTPVNIPERGTAWTPDADAFVKTLTAFMVDLAKLCVRDGEGATKLVTIHVSTNENLDIAHSVASSVARSALVKTALYGQDANWGRILCAIGYAPGIVKEQPYKKVPVANVPLAEISVSFLPPPGSKLEKLPVFVRGMRQDVDEAKARKLLELEDIEILIELGLPNKGPGYKGGYKRRIKYYTCDFSHEYVTINGDYRT